MLWKRSRWIVICVVMLSMVSWSMLSLWSSDVQASSEAHYPRTKNGSRIPPRHNMRIHLMPRRGHALPN